MYFYKKQGKQHVDFRGDLILSHNDALLKARVKSAAPRYAHNGRYVLGVAQLRWFRKGRTTFAAIRFIWGPDMSLTPEAIKAEEL